MIKYQSFGVSNVLLGRGLYYIHPDFVFIGEKTCRIVKSNVT